MVKDLSDRVFKHYIYIEYYDAVLDFAKILRLEKTSNIIFNKEPWIVRKYLI